MTSDDAQLAAVLRGGSMAAAPSQAVLDRVQYHGIGGLILARTGIAALRPEAMGRAMWELRHRLVLTALLAAFDAGGVPVLVMKGTALAYDLYPEPAQRVRGDTDILIAPADLDRARAILRAQGFAPFYDADTPAEADRSQEPWSMTAPDDTRHDIDLHWQALNGATLAGVIPAQDALDEAVPLPRLSPQARALSRPMALIHACVHRAQHIVSPYFVGQTVHFGGDRLIWLVDIDLLARALTPADWELFVTRAIRRGVAPVCLQGLTDAVEALATPLPDGPLGRLSAAPAGVAAVYLLDQGRIGRAVADLRARGDWRARLGFVLRRLMPPAALIRAKYPRSSLPLPLLYLRRLVDFMLGRRR